MKRLLPILFILGCSSANQFLSRDMINQLRDANAVLTVGEGAQCSGVVVGEHLILTAAHCLMRCEEPTVMIRIAGVGTDAAPLRCDVENDIGLIRTERRLPNPRWLASTPAVVGDLVYTVGNPILPGGISIGLVSMGLVSGHDGNQMVLGLFVMPGSSGGAVYNSKGQVVGVVVSMIMTVMGPVVGVAYATPLGPIRKLIEGE